MTMLSEQPAVEVAGDWSFPAYDETHLDNGVRVLVYSCPGQYVVAASLLFGVPLNAESRELEGVAELTARCLTRGAGDLTAEQFADALAMCGADLQGTASPDAFALRLSVPVTHLPRGLELMALAVGDPVFAAEEFAHEQTLQMQEIDQGHAYPQHVAAEELHSRIFGTARAARPHGGTTQTVSAISVDDVDAYARRHLVPAAATLVLAGDFGSRDPADLVARSFSSWRASGGGETTAEHVEVERSPQLLLVDWPDAPQSTIRVAGGAIVRSDPRWAALFVANHAVGGSFSSRINTVLREEKGYTYGASSTLDTSWHTGVFGVSTAVRSDATADAVAVILELVAAARSTITEAEVATAVRAVTQSAPLGFERADSVVSRVELLLSQRLPLDYVDTNLQRMQAVTTDSANAAYAEVIDPAALTVLVVGDATAVRPVLADVGYAPLTDVVPAWR